MMNKKGATHVDWAISMGIFIVYILSMMLIIQPGVQKVFREDNLIQIIENNLQDNVVIEFEKTPMFVTFLEVGNFDGIKYNGDTDLPIGNVGDFKVEDSEGNILESEIIVNGGTDIDFDYTFGEVSVDEKFTFYIYYAEDQFEAFNNPISSDLPNIAVSFGTTEKNKIFSFSDLEDLCLGGYEQLKEDWGYPANKEFSINYIVAANEGEFIPLGYGDLEINPICNDFPEPYEQASIFVKELVKNVYDDGEIKQARINIRVW